jgi:hypothetical protein
MSAKGKLLKTFKWTETKEEMAYENKQWQSGNYSLVYRDVITKKNHLPIIKVYGVLKGK